jgi:hypothetical protein
LPASSGTQAVGTGRQSERLEDFSRNQPLQWEPRQILEKKPQEDGIEVAINRLLPRVSHQLLRIQQGDGRIACLGELEERDVGSEAAGMIQQHPHGYPILRAAREAR